MCTLYLNVRHFIYVSKWTVMKMQYVKVFKIQKRHHGAHIGENVVSIICFLRIQPILLTHRKVKWVTPGHWRLPVFFNRDFQSEFRKKNILQSSSWFYLYRHISGTMIGEIYQKLQWNISGGYDYICLKI